MKRFAAFNYCTLIHLLKIHQGMGAKQTLDGWPNKRRPGACGQNRGPLGVQSHRPLRVLIPCQRVLAADRLALHSDSHVDFTAGIAENQNATILASSSRPAHFPPQNHRQNSTFASSWSYPLSGQPSYQVSSTDLVVDPGRVPRRRAAELGYGVVYLLVGSSWMARRRFS